MSTSSGSSSSSVRSCSKGTFSSRIVVVAVAVVAVKEEGKVQEVQGVEVQEDAEIEVSANAEK